MLTFKIKDVFYALDISVVLEIHSCEGITPLPFLESHVDGVTNVRGYIYPVLNLAKLFQMQEPNDSKNTYGANRSQQSVPLENSQIMIVIGMEGSSQRFAILIDALGDTLIIKEAELSSLPEVESFAAETFILGNIHKNGNTITLLDIDNLSTLMRSDTRENAMSAQV